MKQTLENNNMIHVPLPMRAYPESFYAQTHPVTRRPDPGHLRRYHTNVVDAGVGDTHSNHQLPVEDTSRVYPQQVMRRNADLIDDNRVTGLRNRHQLPVRQEKDDVPRCAPTTPRNMSNQNRRNLASPTYRNQHELLNTAMLEPRLVSRNSEANAVDQEWYDRRTPHTTNSDSL